MSLGSSSTPMSTQPVQISMQAVSEAMLARPEKPQSLAKDFELLARTAAIALQIGTGSSFFREINTNRYFVSRFAFLSISSRDDDTFDKKRAKKIIRDLKAQAVEASNERMQDRQ